MAAMVLRGDKQARAAVHEFEKWHAQKLSQCGDERFQCDLATSPLQFSCAADEKESHLVFA